LKPVLFNFVINRLEMKTSENNISRKDFIRNSALAMAGLTLIPNIMTASPLLKRKVLQQKEN
jgi:hypothetical protein